MKPKMVVLDLATSPWLKKWGLRVGVPAALLMIGGVAFAGLPGGYSDGQPLTAAALDNNFNYLQGEVADLQDGGAALQGQVSNLQAADFNFVDLTSDQTIGGAKMFSSAVVVQGQATVDDIGAVVIGGSQYNNIIGSTDDRYDLEIVGGAPTGTFFTGGPDGGPMGGEIFLGGSLRGDSYVNGILLIQNGVERMRVDNGGNVGIGTTSPQALLEVDGTTLAPAWSVSSDERLKSNIRTLEHPLDDLQQLRGVRFEWKKDGKPSLGVIAQEVERVYPELVATGPDGMKSVDYDKLVAVLIESSKELAAQNRSLLLQTRALQSRMDRLEQRLSRAPTK